VLTRRRLARPCHPSRRRWGAFLQLLGALAFQVTLLVGLPLLSEYLEPTILGPPSFLREAIWTYLPSVFGSMCFTFASCVRRHPRVPGSRSVRPPILRTDVRALLPRGRYVYLLEVAEDPKNPWKPPVGVRERLGYAVAMVNLLGSVLYLVGSLCYFAQIDHDDDEDWDGQLDEWEFLANEWGVRFLFGVGSLCYVIGSFCSFPEILSEFGEKEREPSR